MVLFIIIFPGRSINFQITGIIEYLMNGMNLDEIGEIYAKASSFWRRNLRAALKKEINCVYRDLSDFDPVNISLEAAMSEPISLDEYKSRLLQMINHYTRLRQQAYGVGASSYGNKEWAVPALCESWLMAKYEDDPDLERIEIFVTKLSI